MLMYIHGNGHTVPTVVGFALAVFIIVILRVLQGSSDTPRRSNSLLTFLNRLGFTGSPDLRSTSLQALTEKLAFTRFSPEANYDFVMGWGFLGYLSQGVDRYAFNLLEGTYHEQKLFVFDYHFKGELRDDDDRYYTIFMLIAQEYFPQLLIEPENSEDLFSRAANLFTNNDIKFESAEFSRTLPR
jgi:hypothetical protein